MKQWFTHNQALLLSIANTRIGRDLLCIPHDYHRIVRMGPNFVVSELENGQYLWDFRTHAKWAKVIRSRQATFETYARYFLEQHAFPITTSTRNLMALSASTYSFFSDLGGDGITQNNNATYLTSRNAASGNGSDNTATSDPIGQQFHTGTSTYFIWRGQMPFDTSALVGPVFAATLSLFGTSKEDTVAVTPSLQIVSDGQASNTTVALGDYSKLGGTAFATVTYANWSITAYNDFVLDSNGIANCTPGGWSNFGARTNRDISATPPANTGNNLERIWFNFSDNAGVANDPLLLIVSSTGGIGGGVGFSDGALSF